MKNLLMPFLATAILLTAFNVNVDSVKNEKINPIIGDVSFVEKFGELPNASTDEVLRIKTHLEFVENLLRQKDVSSLSNEMKTKRLKVINNLHDYWMAGKFPVNYDFKNQRKPCFIDKDGNLCAVGYLVEQTVGLDIAEQINSRYKYSEILNMNLPVLTRWIKDSGLTLIECAMIQPTYSEPKPDNYIEPYYGIASSVLSGVNLSLTTLNAVQIGKEGNSKTLPILGLISGTGQLAFGIIKHPKEVRTVNGATSNEGQKVVSLINIGLGSSTVILSSYNLLSNRESSKKKATSWNVFSYPMTDKKIGFGFALTKRF